MTYTFITGQLSYAQRNLWNYKGEKNVLFTFKTVKDKIAKKNCVKNIRR